jgi:hypothetical protein
MRELKGYCSEEREQRRRPYETVEEGLTVEEITETSGLDLIMLRLSRVDGIDARRD